jgi:hypothetical protein
VYNENARSVAFNHQVAPCNFLLDTFFEMAGQHKSEDLNSRPHIRLPRISKDWVALVRPDHSGPLASAITVK